MKKWLALAIVLATAIVLLVVNTAIMVEPQVIGMEGIYRIEVKYELSDPSNCSILETIRR